MKNNKRNQQDIYATWKAARAWLKTLQLKEKSAENRRIFIMKMDRAMEKHIYKRLLTWKLVADVSALGMCLGVMIYAGFEIAKVFFK